MENSKLIYLLRTFNKKERNELDKFIRSPYCNTNQTFIKFWEYLQATAPSFVATTLDSTIVFAYLYPETPKFEERKLRNLKNRFLQLIEQYMVFEALKKDTFTTKKKLKEAYYTRDMYGRFEAIGKEFQKSVQKKPIKNEVDFQALLQLNHDAYFNQRSDKHIASLSHLEQCSKYLDNYYWLSKLKYACEWYSRKIRHREKIPKEFNNFRLPQIFLNSNNQLFTLYQNILSLFQQPIGKKEGILLFDNTIKLFQHHLTSIPTNDQLILLMYLLNYGIAGTRVKNQPFLTNLYELFDLGIQQKILFWKEELQVGIIINIVHIGCKLKKFDWAERMLTENKQYVATKDKESFVTYALANIQFYKREFQDAVFKLENLKFDHLGIEVARRSLQLRSGFECFLTNSSYYSLVNNKSKNFKLFLQRKKRLSADKQLAYVNLIESILEAIFILKDDIVEREAINDLIINVKDKETFIEKDWLLAHLYKQVEKKR